MPALSDQNEPSLSSQIATTFCESASRMRVATFARPARGPRWKLATLGWGFFSVKTCTALTCWASVIGLSTVTVSGTALPFSISGGRSSFTLPGLTRAPPTTLRMASCISAGVARAGTTVMTDASPRPAATPPAVFKKSRRDVRPSMSVPQRHQEGHHVADLRRAEHRLATPGRRHARESLGSMIRRHDRRRIDPAGVDDPEPQLALGPSRAGSPEIGREVALEPLLRKRPAVTEQAQTDLTVGDDRAAARGIAPGARERFRDRVLCVRHTRSEEHTSELQSLAYLVCRLLLEKKKR